MKKEFVKITINATINAPISKVWSSYTEPEHIVNWNFASDDWQCPWAKNDLTLGGKYVARMEAKDGSFGFDFEAAYEEIVFQKKLAYRMPDERFVEIFFQEKSDSVEITIIFDGETMNSVELQQQGWQAILNNYKKYTETL